MSGSHDLLQVRGLRVRFGANEVVRGIDFDIRAGEKVALVGESGSGKSVCALSLVRLLNGAQVQGQVRWSPPPDAEGRHTPTDWLTLSWPELRAVRGSDIAFVFQEPMTALNPLMSVGAQIAEVFEIKREFSREQAWQEAVRLLADTGIEAPEQRAAGYAHQLSGGQRQRALIAMALAGQPRLLVADEPTTALDAALRLQVLALLDDLQRRHGMAVLLITHDLHLVQRFADRMLVMQHGELVEQGDTAEVLRAPRHAYTRQLIDSVPARDIAAPLPDAAERLRVRGLQVSYPVPRPGWRGWFGRDARLVVQGADLSLHAGETLAVIGESGSGKTSLALAVLGLLPFQGQVRVDGQAWTGRAGSDRGLRRRIQVVFQDPFSSLSPRCTVQALLEEGLRLHEPQLGQDERLARIRSTLAEVGLTEAAFPGLLQRYPHEFSGGQRQRLALARALVIEPEVLVLDEPTSALDVSTQEQVLRLLQQLQRRRGLSYLLITHDVQVVRALAHRVLVMKDGQVVEAGEALSVLQNPAHAYTQVLVAALQKIG